MRAMRRYPFFVAALVLLSCGAEEPSFRPARAARAELRDPAESPRAEPMAEAPFPPDDELMPDLLPLGDDVPTDLGFSPADMSTATFGTMPSISIPARGLTESEVAALAARFELVTWPERARVPTRPVYLDEAVAPAVSSRIVFEPTAPLEERWYALRGVPPGGQEPDPKANPVDGDGKAVARFFVGRRPGVQRVLVGPRVGGGGDVEIFYSESVREHASHAHLEVEVDGDVDHCAVGNRRELGSDEGSMVVWLVCPAISPGSHVRIVHRHPMDTAGGGIVTAPDGSELGPIELEVPSDTAAARTTTARDSTATEPSRDGVAVHVPGFGLAAAAI